MKHDISILLPLLAWMAAVAPGAPTHGQVAIASGPVQLQLDADRVVDLSYPEPVPISEIAHGLGTQLGIRILLEPGLRDRDVAVDLRGLSPEAAFLVLANATGVFFKTLTEDSVLMAADTPQNRRSYEEIGVQVFYLRHASVASVTTTLRSILGTKAMAAQDSHSAIVVRDTAARLGLTRQVVEGLDVDPGAAEIDAAFYEVDRLALERWLEAGGDAASTGLTKERVDRLLQTSAARLLASPTIGLRGGRDGRFKANPASNDTPPNESPTLRLALRLLPDTPQSAQPLPSKRAPPRQTWKPRSS